MAMESFSTYLNQYKDAPYGNNGDGQAPSTASALDQYRAPYPEKANPQNLNLPAPAIDGQANPAPGALLPKGGEREIIVNQQMQIPGQWQFRPGTKQLPVEGLPPAGSDGRYGAPNPTCQPKEHHSLLGGLVKAAVPLAIIGAFAAPMIIGAAECGHGRHGGYGGYGGYGGFGGLGRFGYGGFGGLGYGGFGFPMMGGMLGGYGYNPLMGGMLGGYGYNPLMGGLLGGYGYNPMLAGGWNHYPWSRPYGTPITGSPYGYFGSSPLIGGIYGNPYMGMGAGYCGNSFYNNMGYNNYNRCYW